MNRIIITIAVAAFATTAMLGAASAGERNVSGSVTGSRGNTVNCDHSAGGGQSGTSCAGPGGRSASTGASTTRNDDGSVTRSRSTTGVTGQSRGASATFKRQ